MRQAAAFNSGFGVGGGKVIGAYDEHIVAEADVFADWVVYDDGDLYFKAFHKWWSARKIRKAK
jgi:hypothetical protein